jgi:hypothetical protein
MWAAGLAALALFILPVVLTASGVLLMRFVAVEDRVAVQPDDSDPHYRRLFNELLDHGFQPLGLVHEEGWLWLHHLYKCHTIRVLVSGDETTFASLYRLGYGGYYRLTLDTVTGAGVLLQTAMPGSGEPADEPDFDRAEVAWRPVADLLAAHWWRVEDHAGVYGDQPVKVTLAERTAIDRRVSVRQLRRMGSGFVLAFPLIGWVVPCLAAYGLLGQVDDFAWPRRAGLALVAAGACYVLLTRWALPAAARATERFEDGEPVS